MVNKWTNLDTASDLITCILPIMLRRLQDHESKSCLTSSSFLFFCNCAPLCVEFQQKNVIPRMSKGSLRTHAKFSSGSSMSFENRLLRNHTALVFSTLTFRLEHSPKSSKVSRQEESEV